MLSGAIPHPTQSQIRAHVRLFVLCKNNRASVDTMMFGDYVSFIDVRRLIVAGCIVWGIGLLEYLFYASGLQYGVISSIKGVSPPELWDTISLTDNIIQLALMLLAPYFGVRYYFKNRETNFIFGIVLGIFFVIFSILLYAMWNTMVRTVTPEIGRSFSFFEICVLIGASSVFAEVFQRFNMLRD